MKRYSGLSIIVLLVLVGVFASNNTYAQPVKGTVITVNDIGDTVDTAPSDGICADAFGKCTLRAAITESNARTGPDAIIFDVPVPAVIDLTLGELPITDYVGIYGRGARRLTIRRSSSVGVAEFRIFHLISAAQIRGMTIQNGSAPTGGGILADERIQLYDVAITGNHATTGGGIAFQSQGIDTIVERCLINANTATGEGGGIYIAPHSYANIKSSTMTGNTAASGGAIANYSRMTLGNSTISRNAAPQGVGSILNVTGGRISVINTIIGPDTGQALSTVSGGFGSVGSNIVTNITGSTGWTPEDLVSTNDSLNPMLGPLADNGGQIDSMMLLPGSPAINGGDNCVVSFGCDGFPTTDDFQTFRDQRKFIRNAGSPAHVDIGAFESSSNLDSGTLTRSLFFGQTQRIAYSRVTVINTETLARRTTFIALLDDLQRLRGGTPPLTLEFPGVYIAEVSTKRSAIFSPQLFDY